MNTVLFGPPGAGKGTQSAFLVTKMNMKHLSTGDMFRTAIKNKTNLGLEAQKYMDKGDLVPDAIVIGMVEEELVDLNGRSFVLDGFPRTVVQAEALENMLKGKNLKLDRAIFLEVPNETLVRRLSGRRTCGDCGAVFHVETKKPKSEGVCDKCGAQLTQRKDDVAEAIENRLEVYAKNTAPLKGYYSDKGKLTEVDGTGGAEDVFALLKGAIGQ